MYRISLRFRSSNQSNCQLTLMILQRMMLEVFSETVVVGHGPVVPKLGLQSFILTHWGRVTHTCVSKLTFIGSGNEVSPGRCQAIIWTDAGILLIWPLGTNFSEMLIEIHKFSFKKMHVKMSYGKWHPLYLDLNMLICIHHCTVLMDKYNWQGQSVYKSQWINIHGHVWHITMTS